MLATNEAWPTPLPPPPRHAFHLARGGGAAKLELWIILDMMDPWSRSDNRHCALQRNISQSCNTQQSKVLFIALSEHIAQDLPVLASLVPGLAVLLQMQGGARF